MRLHYNTYPGPTEKNVIIIHGLFGSSDNWHVFAKNLSDTATVYTLDMRNHGRSEHDDVFNLDAMSNDLIEFISQQNLQNVTLIGHSMGGKIAMKTSLNWPQLISSLIVVDIAPNEYTSGHDNVFRAFRAVSIESVSSRSQAEQQMRSVLKDESTLQFILKNLRRKLDGSYEWKLNIDIIESQYEEILISLENEGSFDGNVLFIAGGNSSYIRSEHLPMIHKLFPTSTIETIEGAGHWVHVDSGQELLSLSKDFILIKSVK